MAPGRYLRDFRRAGASISDRAAQYLRASRRLWWLRAAALCVLAVPVVAAGYGSWWTIENETNLRVASRLLAVKVGWGSLAAPTMVPLIGDGFPMGSTEDDGEADERPQHQVTVPAFEIGKYEVTFDDYDVFVFDSGARRPPDEDWGGRGRQPAINVSWDDAKAYVEWLSRITGQPYRLPSEAEWEYAARAGTTSPFALPAPDGSDDIAGKGLANCDDCGSEWDGRQTAPVGSFPANGFGLHDTTGNVWEWVEDCWHDSYAEEGRPNNGSAWTSGDCSRRVLRGGSWNYGPGGLRSADRFGGGPDFRSNVVGFRVARTLSRSESVTP